MSNRKLIRPNLAEIKEKMSSGRHGGHHPAREGGGRDREGSSSGPRRRTVPPDQTSAEAFYYLKQMNNQTPMVLVLDDGERLQGHIEWYDRNCIKVHRPNSPNLLIYKHSIRFMYKLEEEDAEAAAAYKPE